MQIATPAARASMNKDLVNTLSTVDVIQVVARRL